MKIAIIGSHALINHSSTAQAAVAHRPQGLDIDIIGSYDDVLAFCKLQESVLKVLTGPQARITKQYPKNAGNKLVTFISDSSGVVRKIIEAEIAWVDSQASELLELIFADPQSELSNRYGCNVALASPDVLYMLKMSHRYLRNSPHFNKTRLDILFLRKCGAAIRPEHTEFFKKRESATYDYKHPSLKQTSGEFFSGDGVNYIYDHDNIHQAVKLFDWPAYTMYMEQGAEVQCSRTSFDRVDDQIRLAGVLGECYVLALERSIIPFPGSDPKKAFDIALMKVCASITSGWFREYAWENYDTVQYCYNGGYVEKFQTALTNGKIGKYIPVTS